MSQAGAWTDELFEFWYRLLRGSGVTKEPSPRLAELRGALTNTTAALVEGLRETGDP